MSEEEKKAIEEQYKEGLVNLSNVIEPLINQFKVDYSLDIQQCRLIINYLLMERDFNEDYYDELDKEIETLKNNNKDLLRKLRNRVKEVKKLEKYSLYKKEFSRLNKELGKKDMIIDLMAKQLEKDTEWYYSKFDDYTKDDFKKYFEKKVNKDGRN